MGQTTHQDVVAVANKAGERMSRLLAALIKDM